MNKKEAIKWLNKNRPCISMICNKENADNINIATDMAIKALEERPTGEWIPVSKRLPDEGGFYLCTFTFDNGNFIEVAQIYYDKILKIFGHGSNRYTVIAWMPLPEPYKEETENEVSIQKTDRDS